MTLLLCLIGLVTGLLLRLGTEVRGRCEGVNSFARAALFGKVSKVPRRQKNPKARNCQYFCVQGVKGPLRSGPDSNVMNSAG